MRALTRGVALGLTSLLTLALAACGEDGTGASGAQTDNTLTYAIDRTPDTFNPVMLLEHTDPVTQMVFRGLVGHDADNQVVPALASDWTVSSDGLTYHFTLREGLTWHDGEPLTSADVKFTLDAVSDPASEAAVAVNFRAVESVEALDDTSVRIILSRPHAALLDALSMGILPEHLLAETGITDPDFGLDPVGNGPFRLVDFRNDQYAELEAFDDFYGGPPQLEGIFVTYVPDASARQLQLESGEIDAAYIDPQQADAVLQEDGLRLEAFPTADYRGLLFNMERPVFEDPALRQAMNHAVDREALVDGVLLGYGLPATGPLGTSPFGQAGVPAYSFDPAMVTELMSEAGYSRDEEGPWTKGGQAVEFSIATFAEDGVRVALMEVVTTQLREAGFAVTADPLPRDAVQWDELDAFVIGWGTPYHPDTSLTGPFDSSQVLAEGGENLGSYANPRVDAALEAGRVAQDETATAAAYEEFSRAIAEDPPYTWLVYLQALNAFPADFVGPAERTLEHHGYGLFWDVENWHWE